jgi:PhzF family phenazine biosynthesis protein
MPSQRFTQVDAFTDRPFAGNPAAICLLAEPREETWMRLVAREMNLPQTAYLLRRTDGFDLRWFTPTTEVELCGHATLASAHVLWESGDLAVDAPARFHTRSGVLTATRDEGGRIWLDFPALPAEPAELPAGLARALGAAPVRAWRNRFDLLVELESETAVRELRPDLTLVAEIPVRGVVVTAASSGSGRDFVTRFFAPQIGIPEDPVTGSAHCTLGPLWGGRLGRPELVGEQVSPRGGVIWVRLVGDRVHLGGRAITVLHGELRW